MAGGGIAGTLAALPMPPGSFTEPFNPRAFAGPGGMPLTPASCAADLAGEARTHSTATLTNATLRVIRPQEKIETGGVRVMEFRSLPERVILQQAGRWNQSSGRVRRSAT